MNCWFSGQMIMAGATGMIFAMGRPSKLAMVSTKDDSGEKTPSKDHAKSVRLAWNGFNVTCVMAGITEFALGYLCHLHPECRNLKLSISFSDASLALR